MILRRTHSLLSKAVLVTGVNSKYQPTGIPQQQHAAIEAAVLSILENVGEDPTRDGLLRTPRRAADAWTALTSGYRMDVNAIVNNALFDVEHAGELVVVRDINVFSLCEHHLLPFFGTAHVAYKPAKNAKVIGLSKLARIVDLFARRFQVQERLTAQVADTLQSILSAEGVAVWIDAAHTCMTMRGAAQPSASTITTALRGVFRDDPAARAEVMGVLGGSSWQTRVSSPHVPPAACSATSCVFCGSGGGATAAPAPTLTAAPAVAPTAVLIAPTPPQHQGKPAAPATCDTVASPASASTDGRVVTLRIAKQAHKFAAGHFTLFPDGTRERLHGHDHSVTCEFTGVMGADGLVVDYKVLKGLIKQLCDKFDERLLVPAASPAVTISDYQPAPTAPGAPPSVPMVSITSCGTTMHVPKDEVLPLPIANVSVEGLACVFLDELRAKLAALHPAVASAMRKIVVSVETGPGQAALAVWRYPRRARSTRRSPSRFGTARGGSKESD